MGNTCSYNFRARALFGWERTSYSHIKEISSTTWKEISDATWTVVSHHQYQSGQQVCVCVCSHVHACIHSMMQCIVVATSCVFVSVTAFRPLEQQVIDCLRHLLSSQGAAVASSSAPPPISLSLTLTQLGGDSLTASRISSLIQEAFCGDVSAQFILKHPLNDVYHLLLSQLLPSQYTRWVHSLTSILGYLNPFVLEVFHVSQKFR